MKAWRSATLLKETPPQLLSCKSDSCKFQIRCLICPQSDLEQKVDPSILKDALSSRTDPSIFISMGPLLLDWSNETTWVFPALKSTSYFLPQSTMSRRSDPSSEANSSSCHRSDAWSHLEQSAVVQIALIWKWNQKIRRKGAFSSIQISWGQKMIKKYCRKH